MPWGQQDAVQWGTPKGTGYLHGVHSNAIAHGAEQHRARRGNSFSRGGATLHRPPDRAPAAILLAELCDAPPGPLAARTAKHVNRQTFKDF